MITSSVIAIRSAHRLVAESEQSPCKIDVMTLQTFRDLLGRRPFQPFRLVMSSGQTYDVRHPEMAFLSRTSIYVAIDEADDGVPADFKICSLLHVTAIEPLKCGDRRTWSRPIRIERRASGKDERTRSGRVTGRLPNWGPRFNRRPASTADRRRTRPASARRRNRRWRRGRELHPRGASADSIRTARAGSPGGKADAMARMHHARLRFRPSR